MVGSGGLRGLKGGGRRDDAEGLGFGEEKRGETCSCIYDFLHQGEGLG